MEHTMRLLSKKNALFPLLMKYTSSLQPKLDKMMLLSVHLSVNTSEPFFLTGGDKPAKYLISVNKLVLSQSSVM